MSSKTRLNLTTSICILLFLLATLASCGGEGGSSNAQASSLKYRISWNDVSWGFADGVYNLLVEFNGDDIPKGSGIRVIMVDPITGEILLDDTQFIDEYRDEKSGSAVKMVFWRIRGKDIYSSYGFIPYNQRVQRIDINWATIELLPPTSSRLHEIAEAAKTKAAEEAEIKKAVAEDMRAYIQECMADCEDTIEPIYSHIDCAEHCKAEWQKAFARWLKETDNEEEWSGLR